MAKRHSGRDVRRLGTGRYCFDPTLYLVVNRNGARSWVQRIHVHGRQVDRGLGGWPVVTLEEARMIALENRRAARRGENPFAPRPAVKTFGDAAAACREANAARWAPTTVKTFDSILRSILPTLGAVPVRDLTKAHVVDCLSAIIRRSLPQARKARKYIVQILEVAVARDWAPVNVVRNGALDAALPQLRESADSHHHAAAPYGDLGGILARLGVSTAADVVRFIALTGCRSTEAREATWSEVDFDTATWTIPASRMKGGREHRVPLSDAAVAILRRQPPGRPFIFVGRSGDKPLDPTTLSKMTKPLGTTVHGLRASLRSWCADTGVDDAVAKACIAHVHGSTTERCYQRSDLLERRRPVMADWAQFLGLRQHHPGRP